MLTQQGLRALSILLKFNTACGILPFSWNSKAQRLQDGRDKRWWLNWDLILTCVLTVNILTRTAFLLVNYRLQRHTITAESNLLFVFWILIFVYNSTCMICYLVKRTEFKNAVNHFFLQ